eukprot:m.124062 g.124062  ORF g.124062 m.124062 type:complete len:935 (-) comp11141_c0_seq2:3094-5898(-)
MWCRGTMVAVTACAAMVAHAASGVPPPAEFDCKMRELAVKFAQEIQPEITSENLQKIVDALNGAEEAQCRNMTLPPLRANGRYLATSPTATTPPADAVIVAATGGSDANPGTVDKPKATIQAAILAARSTTSHTVLLRGGTYMEGTTVHITAADSGLTLANYNDEVAVVSGAVPIETNWKKLDDIVAAGAPVIPTATHQRAAVSDTCNMGVDPDGMVRETPGVYKWVTLESNNITACMAACCADSQCVVASFNNATEYCRAAGANVQFCCGLKDAKSTPTPRKGGSHTIHTIYKPNPPPTPPPTPPPSPPPNIYVTSLPSPPHDITALRLPDGRRGIRARYPNGDPEINGMHTIPTGWVTTSTKWMPSKSYPPPIEVVVNASEWMRHDSTGNELGYQGGIGGSCVDLDPPFGYWCSAHPNRTVSGALTHRSPTGLYYDTLLPHAPYKQPEGAIVHSCRGGANCWFTWMFEVDGMDTTNGTITWSKGGFQGAEGTDQGGVWYIEGVREEIDWPREFYFDNASGVLYYNQNASEAATPPPSGFTVPTVKVLFNISGTMETPVKDVTIQGITLRDAAATFMDPHGMPSGGDWCLQRSGAVTIVGTEGTTLTQLNVTRVDGNAVFVGSYNRNVSVTDSTFQWVGDTAIALWGKTKTLPGGQPQPEGTGIDGTGGTQPRFTTIRGNLISELGHYQKQSSMVFQAQSCQTTIDKNIFFNGPRANINFNDFFGGDNVVSSNLVFNSCRETADHGPFNSWGRQVYITKVRDGQTPSVTPAFTEIRNNFVISNYNGHEAIDNDDASEYLHTHSNFFVYGANGLKSDFEGHDNVHYNNLYAFIQGGCYGVGSFVEGHEDGFYNNTCIATSYGRFDCTSAQLPTMHDNRFFDWSGRNGNITECGKSLAEWQAEGHDVGTTASTDVPSADSLIAMASSLLSAHDHA